MKKIKYLGLIGGLAALLFLIGCLPTGGDEILNINLYDENGKLIKGTGGAMAVVSGVQNVKYIQVNSGMRNEGNVELFAKLQVFAPRAITTSFKQNNPSCYEVYTDYVICADKEGLSEKEMFVISTDLIDVETIGYGSHNLLAKATAQYTDETGARKTIGSEKTMILTIEKDPINAQISVDIATSSDIPPPPCRFSCPDGMYIIPSLDISVKMCGSDPIIDNGNITCKMGAYNAVSKLCEFPAKKICIVN